MSRVEEKVGSRTKMEPTVKPMILKNVGPYRWSNKNFVSFIKQNPPMTTPVAMGSKIGKSKLETEVR